MIRAVASRARRSGWGGAQGGQTVKKHLFGVVVLALMAMAVPRAEAEIGIFGSFWDAGDMESGYGGGLKWSPPIPTPIIGVDVRASWLGFSKDGESANVIPLEAAGYLDLNIAYGGVGIGYYIFNSGLKDKVGLFALAGVKIKVIGIGVFGEVMYRFVDTEFGSTKVNTDGAAVNLGVLLGF